MGEPTNNTSTSGSLPLMTWRDRTIVSHFCSQRKPGDLLSAPSSATIVCLFQLLSTGPLGDPRFPDASDRGLFRPLLGLHRAARSRSLRRGLLMVLGLLRALNSGVHSLSLASCRSSDHVKRTAVYGGDAGERGGDVKPSSVTVGKAVVMGRFDQVTSDTVMLPVGTNRSLMSAQQVHCLHLGNCRPSV